MDEDKDTKPADTEPPKDATGVTTPSDDKPQQAPADALSLTPDEVKEEEQEQGYTPESNEPVEKKLSPLKRLFRKVNIYLLIFILLVVIVAVIAVVNYLNSQKPAATPNIGSQSLSQDALKQLANTNTSVGGASQTLTIQGNAVIDGQTLSRGNLDVAANLQVGGNATLSNLTISGTSNLGTAQINSLQVASNVAIQGSTTLAGLNVAGAASFGGAITASQITVSSLTVSGNGIVTVPNHISFSGGPTPGLSSGSNLGNGGSASINGSDTSGTINISTGGGATSGCFAAISFHQSFSGQPRITIGPIGSGAGVSQYYLNAVSQSGFSICAANTPPSNTSFAFDYFVTG